MSWATYGIKGALVLVGYLTKDINKLVALALLMLNFIFAPIARADEVTKAYCDLPLQETATVGQMIKPYPVVALNLNGEGWLTALQGCGSETLYVVILADYHNENTQCDEVFSSCSFDLFETYQEADSDPESLHWYEVHLSLYSNDKGGWAFKIDECPRSSEIVATGFYRINYLGGNYQAGAYNARTVMPDPVRAEATWGLVNESCFGFGELEYAE